MASFAQRLRGTLLRVITFDLLRPRVALCSRLLPCVTMCDHGYAWRGIATLPLTRDLPQCVQRDQCVGEHWEEHCCGEQRLAPTLVCINCGLLPFGCVEALKLPASWWLCSACCIVGR